MIRLSACAGLILFVLTGCVTPSTPKGIECLVFESIRYDSSVLAGVDARELKAHNLKWLELCDGGS